MTSADVVATYEHCLARDSEFSRAAGEMIAEARLDTGAGDLLVERAAFRLRLLDMLERWPMLARLGRPAWVAEFELSHTTEG